MKGFTVGGGWRWRSANVIGADSEGNELTGEPIVANDLMFAYTRKFERLPGRVRFQLNVSNVFDHTDILPCGLRRARVCRMAMWCRAVAGAPMVVTI